MLTWLLGPGAIAIGTNKILGSTSAVIALLVYWTHGHLWPKNRSASQLRIIVFVLAGIVSGTVLGAAVAPHLPVNLFPWALLFFSPVILWVILSRDSLIRSDSRETSDAEEYKLGGRANFIIRDLALGLTCGFACGFYDGVFGPGGGTLMLLALVLLIEMPLLQAMALSKLANSLSAGGSLITYAYSGHVVWPTGLWLAIFIGAGALVGSSIANKHASKIVRPLLALVVSILWCRMAWELLFKNLL